MSRVYRDVSITDVLLPNFNKITLEQNGAFYDEEHKLIVYEYSSNYNFIVGRVYEVSCYSEEDEYYNEVFIVVKKLGGNSYLLARYYRGCLVSTSPSLVGSSVPWGSCLDRYGVDIGKFTESVRYIESLG